MEKVTPEEMLAFATDFRIGEYYIGESAEFEGKFFIIKMANDVPRYWGEGDRWYAHSDVNPNKPQDLAKISWRLEDAFLIVKRWRMAAIAEESRKWSSPEAGQ